jgi:hypothetical protein
VDNISNAVDDRGMAHNISNAVDDRSMAQSLTHFQQTSCKEI